MTIIFLCGSLEPGCDGVGDYTRRLAGELMLQGHIVAIVALYDKGVKNMLKGVQQIDDISLPVLRLPFIYNTTERVVIAKEWIQSFNPDWISLQYVPYSFQNKGLPFGFAGALQKMCCGIKCHIMFHELWVGISTISPLKHKITGMFQRKIVVSICKALQPAIVTTSNRLYQLLLSNCHISSTILPLFSNIPIAAIDQHFVFLILNSLSIKHSNIDQFVLSGFFGNLYPEAKLEQAIQEQLLAATTMKKMLVVIGFGKMNSSGVAEFKLLEAQFKDKVKFLYLGEQPEEKISNLMQMMNVAFSCTPAQHIGKSGVFAALKLHGLQVIVPQGDRIPEYDEEIKKYNETFVKRPAYSWGVDYIANRFQNLIHTIDA